ncbi:unnamed protein product [Cylicocyclus nassatus]|uniref:Uncharacterized protein n=1 Tax=Cylicocyclus nassatus TaxID=53992 RepID=A0AA36MAX8_CYLNA|nr:unnamed protein product [Cylicocyclus nassatus]
MLCIPNTSWFTSRHQSIKVISREFSVVRRRGLQLHYGGLWIWVERNPKSLFPLQEKGRNSQECCRRNEKLSRDWFFGSSLKSIGGSRMCALQIP